MNFSHYLDWLVTYEKYVLLGLMLLFSFSLIIFIIINSRMNNLVNYYQKMLRGMEGKNLEEMLYACLEQSRGAAAKVEELSITVENLQQQTDDCLQRTALIRFNAFEDTGGEMSFALALLDRNANGLIISNLYSRQESHVYLRSVKEGKAASYLLPQEQQALEEALKA